jgi:hypothetical protein
MMPSPSFSNEADWIASFLSQWLKRFQQIKNITFNAVADSRQAALLTSPATGDGGERGHGPGEKKEN